MLSATAYNKTVSETIGFKTKERCRCLVAVLPTRYGKSLVLHVSPRLLKERDAIDTSQSTTCRSVVLAVSPSQTISDFPQ